MRATNTTACDGAEQTRANLPDADDDAHDDPKPGLLQYAGWSIAPLGQRPWVFARRRIDRIVTPYVAARRSQLNGPDLVVAAEKPGCAHGIWHRLVDGHELGPVFSVANMVKPGNFDLTCVQDGARGHQFFMTPASADARARWDAMLPTARMAELLDALVLDERNALAASASRTSATTAPTIVSAAVEHPAQPLSHDDEGVRRTAARAETLRRELAGIARHALTIRRLRTPITT